MSSEVIDFLQGTKITPFERPWSTMTKIESYPSAKGRSVIKSMEQLAKGLVDFAPLVGMYAGFEGVLSILNCWQVHIPVRSSLQKFEVLATSNVVILHYMSLFLQGVLLFHDHERFSQCLVVVLYFLVYSSFRYKIKCFVRSSILLSSLPILLS